MLMIGKMLIYQTRSKRHLYSIVNFEKLIETERELEEIYAIRNDKFHIYVYPGIEGEFFSV